MYTVTFGIACLLIISLFPSQFLLILLEFVHQETAYLEGQNGVSSIVSETNVKTNQNSFDTNVGY